MKKIFFMFLTAVSFLGASELNIYSARHYNADFEIIKKFEEKTGIKVNHTQAKASELIKRLSLEGSNSGLRLQKEQELLLTTKTQISILAK